MRKREIGGTAMTALTKGHALKNGIACMRQSINMLLRINMGMKALRMMMNLRKKLEQTLHLPVKILELELQIEI